ncbi:MAG: hypothetical protein QOG50_2728 [Actinomycetota bacterium]|nr:hypothetical protein [Actinomycetota bacterium]
MSSISQARATTIKTLRRIARRPRAFVRAARAHRSTVAAQRLGRRWLARGSLTMRSLAGRRARSTDWANVVADVAALSPAPALVRSVSIVVIAPEGAPIAARAGVGRSRVGHSGVGRSGDSSPVHAVPVDVVIARATRTENLSAAAGRAAETTRGDLLCFLLASTSTIDTGWLDRLAAAVDGATVVAAAPVVVHPMRSMARATPDDGRVRARGLDLDVSHDVPVVLARDAGAHPAVGAPPVTVPGATAACLLVDRRAYAAAGGLPDLGDLDLAAFELCRRLRAHGGEVVAVSAAIAIDHRPAGEATRKGAGPIPADTPVWRAYIEEHGPELMREASPLAEGRLRIALTVAAPSEKVASRWGDWHLAQAFAGALRREGHVVRVQTHDHADDLAGRACDVHCVVRGLQPVRRTAGQVHVLWMISHPESVDPAECDAADLVLVASVRFADALRARTRTPVEVMLQATDTDRFRPRVAAPEHRHDVAIVAKSRDVFRSAAADAVALGLRPAIYGSGWEQFVDPALVVREYVPNDELPTVYSSVGVLLNDHWQTMRDWGFVSNRLFDALACGTPVISDDLVELDDLFAGAVLEYHDARELRDLVAATLADPAAARDRAARGRELVREHHTFDHRAHEFLDALHRHDLA